MSFRYFFSQALLGHDAATEERQPYPYQERLVSKAWPDMLNVPTGMGKTAAVTLAWVWKRGWRQKGEQRVDPQSDTPRRLVWCLPMRVLVEQTENTIRQWLQNLGVYGDIGSDKVSLHVLMGGESDLKTWAEHPEEDMILVGTQDMLLSRALMRGYGMSRYQWPIHFALLHNDCFWVFDEVQLMGAGLTTSVQLEAFRRDAAFPLAKSSRTLWVSATLNKAWLKTVDMDAHNLCAMEIDDKDREQARAPLSAVKSLQQAAFSLTGADSKKQEEYLDKLCKLVLEKHDASTQTLVILNRVDRAQKLFERLGKQREGKSDLLIHARFRAKEREDQVEQLHKKTTDRIIVATQAIEAGVDVSSRVLITELAPLSSMVQRFGRCNRYGEHHAPGGAHIIWLNVETKGDKNDEKLCLPYGAEELKAARYTLKGLESASPDQLSALAKTQERPLTATLRRKDLLELFNTDPDLSGFDVDVSDYIRDSDTPGCWVFWRDFDSNRGQNQSDPDGKPEGRPQHKELCPISISQAKDIHKRKRGAWYWDTLGDSKRKKNGQWVKLDRAPRPGMTLLLCTQDGGYDLKVGFDASLKKKTVPVVVDLREKPTEEDAFTNDQRSHQKKPVDLVEHLGNVAREAKTLCEALDETNYREAVIRAARWHDLGKAHPVFQATMHACAEAPQGLLAKSPCDGRHERPFFRHELASMLGWLAQHGVDPEADLIAYLVLAHHGKVRTSLRAMPAEKPGKGVSRFARGIWEGDTLPALTFDGEHSAELTLKLALMELGEGEQGRSWSERALTLLKDHGPFRLAWLETLVRLADWRASAEEQRE